MAADLYPNSRPQKSNRFLLVKMRKLFFYLMLHMASYPAVAQKNIMQSHAAPIDFQPVILVDNQGQETYEININTTYDEIRYSFGTPVRKQVPSSSTVTDTFLVSLGQGGKSADYLEVSLDKERVISFRLVRKNAINPVVKTMKRFSTGKYANINKLSVLNISPGDDFEESKTKLLTHPDFEYTQTNSNKLSVDIIAGKKIILIPDAFAKVAQIELFADEEDIH